MSLPPQSWQPAGPALLFCPADRPERYVKAADRADVVILDLEDAVAPENKPTARQALVDTPLDPARVIVRVNPVGTDDHAADLAALAQTGYRVVMLAKAEDAASVAALDYAVIGLIETPLGAVRCEQIAAVDNCVGLMWGAEDLVAGLGGKSSRFGIDEPGAGNYRDVPSLVRAQVRLVCGAFGKAAIDAVHVDIADVIGLGFEVRDAVALGYAGTACIHPSQVPVVREGYTPSPEEIDWARRVLAAAEEFGGGVFALDGQMVDAPLFGQALAVLRRVGEHD
ncbi:putative citrate lyase subunit beta [Gordonia hirsuta DSM 44140 = NBRC 16056]|uniref:Putative citrate lyase subunit beta n=1 Tax=Gordonia hirsuta DSM 44140 = NBRC 16056 TaxID=1121927 RepID=L7L9B8_9ACTN|nr:CoA ester lyase [Gordonia hirsuta]GAC57489.1 putative citrate lyase subunit beta [Gordonia hirsuta DSM 44140 = NBRC 16056]